MLWDEDEDDDSNNNAADPLKANAAAPPIKSTPKIAAKRSKALGAKSSAGGK